MKPRPDFSVVLPIYRGDDAYLLTLAVTSLMGQSIQPNEIILVIDGYILPDIDSFISKIEKDSELFTVIRLAHNVGAGPARHIGIQNSSHQLIALMDADDFAFPYRFERQLEVFANMDVDVVGGLIVEAGGGSLEHIKVRKVPQLHHEILKFAKWRQPVNNVTTMFKKEIYFRAGGFRSRPFFEDWDLWTRALMSGGRFHNIQEPLVRVTAGAALVQRRRGADYRKSEIEFLKSLRSSGFINTTTFLVSMLIRTMVRYLPSRFVGFIYQNLLRTNK